MRDAHQDLSPAHAGLESPHAAPAAPSAITLIDAIERATIEGLRTHHCVLVVASMSNLWQLEQRLPAAGFNLATLQAHSLYTRLNVHEALSQYMVAGQPDTALFEQFVIRTLDALRRAHRPIRVVTETTLMLDRTGAPGSGKALAECWRAAAVKFGFTVICLGFGQPGVPESRSPDARSPRSSADAFRAAGSAGVPSVGSNDDRD